MCDAPLVTNSALDFDVFLLRTITLAFAGSNTQKMKLPSLSFVLLLPATCLASSATVYLATKSRVDEWTRSPTSLSPYEANSVLAHHIGIARSLFSEVFDDAVDFGKKEWNYLWQSAHLPSSERPTSKNQNKDTAVIFIQSDHPQGECLETMVRGTFGAVP